METMILSIHFMSNIFPIFVVVISPILTLASTAGIYDCAVPLGSQGDSHLPLLISQIRGLLIPKKSRSIVILNDELVQVNCPGYNNQIIDEMSDHLQAICKNNSLLEYSTFIPFTLKCKNSLTETVLETNKKCGLLEGSKVVEIGWSLNENHFLPQIEICFSEEQLLTEYSKHTLRGAGVYYRDRDPGRPSFIADNFFLRQKPPISIAYSKNIQLETLTNLLGDKKEAEKHIGGWGTGSFLARGHLAPDADFSLQTWQDATYHHLNIVPQWQSFNNQNWKILEGAIRLKAARPCAQNLTIYTGTYGILTLPDINNNEVEVYLLKGQKLPVPRYIWKVIVNERQTQAVGFVSINRPPSPIESIEKPICSDICDRIKWVTWTSRNDSRKGIIYCCTLKSLRKVIPSLPYFHGIRVFK